MTIDDVADFEGVSDRVEGLRENEKYLFEYDSFKKAKKIGIIFGPKDLTLEQVNAFYEIETKIEEMINEKRK